MIPTLFPSTYIENLSYSSDVPTFPEHGIVDLIDCIECFAEHTEDEGSEWELAFTYPCNGQGVDELQLDAIVLAKANAYQNPQAFRIYSAEHKTDKILTVKAQHISYDMANTPVKPFTATSPSDAVTKLRTNTIYGSNWQQHHFFVSTDLTSTDEFKFDAPTSMRSVLLDGDNSIQGTYGGDLIFDNYDVKLLRVGGADRGVSIDYGVDLVDMTQEKNNSEMITGILPYYKRTESDELYSTEPIMYGDIAYGPGTYDIQKIKPVDLSEYFPNAAPTRAQLNAKAAEWVAAEEIGIPEISLTVSYAHLGQDVRMHDAIRVNFPAIKVDTKAKVVKEKYNVLLEICEEVEVGHAKTSAMFNLMDASRLRKGLIPPERVANNSLTGDKLANGSVGKGKVGAGAIGKYEIEPMSIDHDLLSKKAGGGGGGGESGAAVELDNIGYTIFKPVTHSADYDPDVSEGVIINSSIGVSPRNLPLKMLRVTDSGTGTRTDDPNDYELNPTIVTDGTLPGGKVVRHSMSETQMADSAVSTRVVQNAAVAYAKLSSEMQGKITKIDNLEASIAYINKLFASSATIDDVWAKNLHASSNVYSAYVRTNYIVGYSSGRQYTQRQITDGSGNTLYVWGASG